MAATLLDIQARDPSRLDTGLGLDAATARIEVQCLLQNVLQVGRAYLYAHPERELSAEEQHAYSALLQRRLAGEPIAHILGEREFFGLDFKVTPATLIPRPDTELLVELALQKLPAQQSARVLDLGTGTGAIALSIAHARPDADVVAVDASPQALAVARENAQRFKLARVQLLESNWFAALDSQRFDVVVSNPPYIAADDPHLAQGDVRFEPRSALVAGQDGLDDIRHIIAAAHSYLVPGGWLLFEHGYDQAAQVRALLQVEGFRAVFSTQDLAGIERCSGGQL